MLNFLTQKKICAFAASKLCEFKKYSDEKIVCMEKIWMSFQLQTHRIIILPMLTEKYKKKKMTKDQKKKVFNEWLKIKMCYTI